NSPASCRACQVGPSRDSSCEERLPRLLKYRRQLQQRRQTGRRQVSRQRKDVRSCAAALARTTIAEDPNFAWFYARLGDDELAQPCSVASELANSTPVRPAAAEIVPRQ